MSEPLVLLPGMMCDARVFGAQLTALSRERAVMVAPITLGERVEEIASNIIDQLPHRFALAGLSMGGIVAMEVLRRVPDRISRLCLMDTNPLAETPAEAAAREPLIVRARAGFLEDVMQEAMHPDILAPGTHRRRVLDRVYQMARDMGPEVFVNQSRALQRRRDQQGTLRKSHTPTLILCGTHDPLTPVKRHSFMAELMPHADLLVMENAGHFPSLECPDELTKILRNWLARPASTT